MKKSVIAFLLISTMLSLISFNFIACKKCHTHKFDQEIIEEKYLASNATPTSQAKYYYSCICGEKGLDVFEDSELSEEIEVLQNSRWKSKNVLIFGDSISDYDYASIKKWNEFYQETVGCNMFNYSEHGYGYLCGQNTVNQGQYNMINQIERAYNELSAQNIVPDLIVLFMGTNDYGNIVPFGEYGDGTNWDYVNLSDKTTFLKPKHLDTSQINTFIGAVEHCMARVKELFQLSQVAVLLPLQRASQTGNVANGRHSLLEYVDAIKVTAERFSYPVLDLYRNGGFVPAMTYDRINYTYKYKQDGDPNDHFSYDGLHPNQWFSKTRLMPQVRAFLEQI